jgi:pimeloyl-ACP methyl ester carboxylesterase
MMSEQIAHANGLAIAYETFGDPSDQPLLLVMGLGMQMIHWDPAFCELLASRGFHVIRFDNRDTGHSTKIEGGPRPNVIAAMAGNTRSAPYRLNDMAADAAGLLDHLEIEAAHVVGVSMGGMIAQQLAARHPDRVLSLCSIMSTTGARIAGLPRLGVLGVLFRKAPRDRDAYVEHFLRIFKRIGSPGFPMDEERVRTLASAGYDRCFYPAGVERQLVAIMASGNRTADLRRVTAPTLVIHGGDDPLVPLRGGRATARAIHGAQLLVIDGMGHDLPREAWPQIADAIERNAGRAEAPGRDTGAAATVEPA